MALVPGRIYLSVTLVDTGGNETTRRIEMASTDLTEAAVDAPVAILALQAVTDAVIRSYHWYQEISEDAFAFPAGNVQIENQALLDFTLEDPLKTAVWSLPAPKSAIFVAATGSGNNIVNPAQVSIAAWAALFTDPADNTFLISDGEKADIFNGGRRIHRGSRRG